MRQEGNSALLKKNEREERAMSGLKNNYVFGEELYSLWREFEERKTSEAKYVQALDKLETLTHMVDNNFVAKKGDENGAIHTVTYADEAIKNFPALRPMLVELKDKMKNIFDSQGFVWKEEYNIF
jgi:5'-deoxynucleotidase YfbR-like HD superfamily hydrolase